MNAQSPRTPDEFADEVLRAFMARIDAQELDNVDEDYPAFGLTCDRVSYDARRAAYLTFLLTNRQPLFETYQLWQDDASRELFFDLLLFRALGHERVRLPSNNPAFWESKRAIQCHPSSFSGLASLEGAGKLRHFELALEHESCRLDCLPINILFTFLLRQYHLRRDGISIQPVEGDHVIDAGACLGDTAIDFAHVVGARGRVHAFEVVDSHLHVFRHNLGQNPDLANVVLHPVGLSDRSQSGVVAAIGLDPGFSITNQNFTVPLRQLDDLVDAGDVERVDLIKMDIEGHELSALRGAEQTLRRFRPRLAISLYHNWDDYFRIPLHLDRLGLGYRFYLENYTISDGETIMYGAAEPQ